MDSKRPLGFFETVMNPVYYPKDDRPPPTKAALKHSIQIACCRYLCVRRSKVDPSTYVIFTVTGGKEIAQPLPQTSWDAEQERQEKEEKDIQETWDNNGKLSETNDDGVTYCMQQTPDNYWVFALTVDFPELGYACSYDNLHRGISQWYCKVYGERSLDALFVDIAYHRHPVFHTDLVSVPQKIYRYLAALLTATPRMSCGCVACSRRKIRNAYYLTIYLDDGEVDNRPAPGKYMNLAVCENLQVKNFFEVLHGAYTTKNKEWNDKPYERFFRKIEGPDDEGKYHYGDCYRYETFEHETTTLVELNIFDGEMQAVVAIGAVLKVVD